MQKMTLLQVVQDILAAIDSDSVASIGETIESEQIVLKARTVFQELATYQMIPQFAKITQLRELSDTTRATVMRIPEGATDIKDVRYKVTSASGKATMDDIPMVDNDTFMRTQLALDTTDTTKVGVNVLDGNVRIPYYTDRAPSCWTTFDEEHLIFDAIDRVKQGDSTLHNDHSMVTAYIIPEFKLEDDALIPLPLKLIPQFLSQLKERSTHEQKQLQAPIDTRNGERSMHRNRWFAGVGDGIDRGPGGRSLGRRLRGYGRSRDVGQNGLPKIRS